MKQDSPLPSWFSTALENTRKNYRWINISASAIEPFVPEPFGGISKNRLVPTAEWRILFSRG
jgi:hypothetical protein